MMFQGDVQIDVDGIVRALPERPKLPLAQASNFLELTARLYEPLWRHRSLSLISLGKVSVTEELEMMLEHTSPQPHMKLLDAACSAGLYARTFLKAEPTLTVHAVDISLPFLHDAKRRAGGLLASAPEDVGITLVEADVQDLPHADTVFDVVVAGGSLNEFIDLAVCMASFARVLKPGGCMWQMYVQPAQARWSQGLQGLLGAGGIRFIELDELVQLAEVNGLGLEHRQTYGVIVMDLFRKRAS
ncbi:MAG: class I SAM-dependent methyltransferase [Deinococcota bacterium]